MAFQDEIFRSEGENLSWKFVQGAETIRPKMTIRPLDEQAQKVK